MKTVFADTFYFIAQLSPGVEAHQKANAFTAAYAGRFVTSDWVLVELADALARPPNRARLVRFVEILSLMHDMTIVPADRANFQQGLDRYRQRLDKDWSLTDCISFAVMEREGITEALTGDHHFEQAGFVALLK
jgi:predicted nucleic acid-binding protein